jgi:hypothetical protein
MSIFTGIGKAISTFDKYHQIDNILNKSIDMSWLIPGGDSVQNFKFRAGMKLNSMRFGALLNGTSMTKGGAKASPSALKYIETIFKETKGDYNKRNSASKSAVVKMVKLVRAAKKKHGKKASSYTTHVDFIDVLYSTLTSKDNVKAFKLAAQYHKAGSEVGTYFTIWYVGMVYNLEQLVITAFDNSQIIHDGNFEMASKAIVDKFPVFCTSVNNSAAMLVGEIRKTKGFYNDVKKKIKAEKSTEGYDPSADMATEELATIIAVGAASVAGFFLLVWAARSLIYHLSCLTVDLSESLRSQSYTILVGVESLRKKRDALDPKSKEYKELDGIITKQEAMVSTMVDIANKLSDDDMKTLDQVRELEYEDAEITTLIEKDEGASDDDSGVDDDDIVI